MHIFHLGIWCWHDAKSEYDEVGLLVMVDIFIWFFRMPKLGGIGIFYGFKN